jgi:hypothetical protein
MALSSHTGIYLENPVILDEIGVEIKVLESEEYKVLS